MGQFFPKTHFGHKWGQDSGQSNLKLKSIRAKYIDKQNNFVDHVLIYFGNMKKPGIKVDAWFDFRLVFLSTKNYFFNWAFCWHSNLCSFLQSDWRTHCCVLMVPILWTETNCSFWILIFAPPSLVMILYYDAVSSKILSRF